MKFVMEDDFLLLDALAKVSPKSSKTTLRSWLKEGRVQVDGIEARNSALSVQKGQIITIGNRKKFISGDIEILYEDRDLVIINKPSGLLSVSTAFEKGETAHALLKRYYRPRHVYVVHRIDQETSGIMVFALNETAMGKLKGIFEKHEIKRSYIAIVEGRMTTSSGTWKSYQYEDEQYKVHETNDPQLGREAITHFKVITNNRRYSLLNLSLETGRKNQIRVHCQSAGHPIVGDKKYGGRTNPIKRLCLHAYLLSFHHPITNKRMQFEIPIPEEFSKLIQLK